MNRSVGVGKVSYNKNDLCWDGLYWVFFYYQNEVNEADVTVPLSKLLEYPEKLDRL